METRMRLYVILFRNSMHLSRAFDIVLTVPEVDSCVVESKAQCIRFIAPRSVAEFLVERIYLHGGLSWCSSYPLEASEV